MANGTRLDRTLLQRGLCPSRSAAQRAIWAGDVFVDGQMVDKPASLVDAAAQIELRHRPRYVSRGGQKLEGALEAFRLDPTDRVCLDVGASTGGFTDCLLQHGARKVYAVDVGHGQLDWSLRRDPRVISVERCNARYLSPAQVPEPVSLATVDVSFISVTKILPALFPLLGSEADLIVLVKPQFEAGRERVCRGGVVRDPATHAHVLRITASAASAVGSLQVAGATVSPVTGPAGNIEFFLWLTTRNDAQADVNWLALIRAAHDQHGPATEPSD